MKNLTTINQLVKQFQIHDFVEKTIAQINKDLNGLADGIVNIQKKESQRVLVLLINEMKIVLEELSRNSQLQQFIYTVDLKEKVWLNFMQKQDFEGLAEQIIIREAQKVYLREMFKQ